MPIWGPIIGAGISALGSIIGGKMNSDSNEEDRAFQAAQFEKNVALQKEFAQNGVRWKMEDAARAGLHPLVGAGAQAQSFSPISVGSSPNHSMGNAMSDIGQNIGRAISTTQTQNERTISDLQVKTMQADLDGKLIDNAARRSSMSAPSQIAPAFPGDPQLISGQGDTRQYIQDQKLQRTGMNPQAMDKEAGSVPGVGWYATPTGLIPVPSSDVKQRIEDNVFHEAGHYLQNNVSPYFGGTASKPPKGEYHWGGVPGEWRKGPRPKTVPQQWLKDSRSKGMKRW